jgi:CheY-like chemotaxis protein
MAGDEQRALAAGCDDYIAKPITDAEVVRRKLENLLLHGRGGNAVKAGT